MWRVFAFFILASFTFQEASCKEDFEEDSAYNCSEHSIYECAYPADIQKFHAVASKEELEPLCENLHKYLRCIDTYTRKCLQPVQRSHFNRLFSGTSMVIHEICSEGHYQTEFLKHAVCMKTLNDEFDSCSNTYHDKIAIIDKSPQIGQSICCPLREYMSCLNSEVSVHCGEVAANFSVGFNERLFHAIMTTHCSTEESDCSASGALSTSPHFVPPVLFIMMTVLWFNLFCNSS